MVKTDAGKEQTDVASNKEPHGNLQAALARTVTRGMALYFSRPVRLFRPSKVSGWQILRGLAEKDGSSLNHRFLSSLVKDQGFLVIPKHFIPPMMVNAVLGTVLWTTYGEASATLEPYLGSHPIVNAALSGAIAGGAQAVVAAPAENVRLLLEGGSVYHSWSHAWKEVFRGTHLIPSASREEIREVRSWMRDVGDMAGRGWDGWGWGCAKDMCGFALFFSIFEITRRISVSVKEAAHNLIASKLAIESLSEKRKDRLARHFPRTMHGVTLVTGGVVAGLAYEFVGRPWDNARHTVQLDLFSSGHAGGKHSPFIVLFDKFREEGLAYFFRNPYRVIDHSHSLSPSQLRLNTMLRTLGRVGPWGVGFLVWETYSSS
ncbi:uncharacterized protein BT62DRAFT_977494 [Guyanagaster necrorhizus]|uniref:Mitochondrial carrier protein n=1 Tax=Guyanagaster necrorhizus TaxID=856835 RepID=A0A9P7W802_9AGAR|nr:uncharacterized protein BT62DRAFT_977494 [Guyanagaster necrorhizus MCA 3950]KAG7453011.1 hypothetical protein BT62DRAFT_977494 [Guyanagaster necrorhizus MCA 3950]